MVDITASLDNATSQVQGLLAQLRLGNTRFLEGQDTGAADAYVVQTVPPVAAYGADLVMLVDFGAPNQTTSPKVGIGALPFIPLQNYDGTPPLVGSVSGKRLVGFGSTPSGGYAAKLIGLSLADVLAQIAAATRLRATGATTLFVRQGGSDQNNGADANHPFATPQAAWDYLARNIDANRYNAFIDIGPGLFPGFVARGLLTGQDDVVTIQGAGSAQTTLLGTAADTILTSGSARIRLRKMTLQNNAPSNTGNCCLNTVWTGTRSTVGDDVIFANSSYGFHIRVSDGAETSIDTAYYWTGGAISHLGVVEGGTIYYGAGLACTGPANLSWPGAFAYARGSGSDIYVPGSTTISATNNHGVRANAVNLSLINVNGGGANVFPGDQAPTQSGGGLYTN